jgi:serine/threonine protein kinase
MLLIIIMGNKLCCTNKINVASDKIPNLIEKHYFNIADYNPVFLGNGLSGNTYKITLKGTLFTCKKINKKHEKYVRDEIQILNNVRKCNYLPNFYKCIEYNEYFNILYRYIDGVELFEMMDNCELIEIDTPIIIKEISLALKALFKYGYVHLDIKPANILIVKKNPIKLKLIDLAFCKKINGCNDLVKGRGTSGYISPEVYLHKKFFHNTDVWSLGIIFNILLTGENIFSDDNFIQELTDFVTLEDSCIFEDTDCYDLLNKMLTKDPSYRISVDDVLKHKFIRES